DRTPGGLSDGPGDAAGSRCGQRAGASGLRRRQGRAAVRNHPLISGSAGGHVAAASRETGQQTTKNRERRATVSLQGKAAVITGSTSGIGLAIAEALAAPGVTALVNVLVAPPADAEAIADSLARKHGVQAIFHGADMRQPAQIAAMLDQAVETLGSVDILVNDAGIQH